MTAPPASDVSSAGRPAGAASGGGGGGGWGEEHTSIRETLTSIIIAFVMAFVFRAFVVEAFIIPTGSMAPTLMGAHMRFDSEETGANWPVAPWHYHNRDTPKRIQGQTVWDPVRRRHVAVDPPVVVHDPMSGERFGRTNIPRRAGDRILVLKYLYSVFDPRRWDVVVFKAPETPQTNFIKRLVGLPGEQVALIDGDVFTRRPLPGEPDAGRETWNLGGWRIARKPERVQRALWEEVFNSASTPLDALQGASRWFVSPWVGGGGGGWAIEDRASYEYNGSGPTILEWDADRWPVVDRYPYNEIPPIQLPQIGFLPVSMQTLVFPVSDVNISFGLEPGAGGDFSFGAAVLTRGHEFQAHVQGASATLRMRAADEDGPSSDWVVLGTGRLAGPPRPGRITSVEFWHVDQSLSLWIDGRRIAYAEYDWGPDQRLRGALSMSISDVLARERSGGGHPLANPHLYTPARPRVEFGGGPFTLHRVALSRDVHYQAASVGRPDGLRATHPERTPSLGPDHFFVLGDNSPASSDARMWARVDEWVAARIDPTPGVVPRELLIGKAFFVYFPALVQGARGPIPVPDFGRMRFIW